MPSACNYDPLATTGDIYECDWASCYSFCGYESSACNYDPFPTVPSMTLQSVIWDIPYSPWGWEDTAGFLSDEANTAGIALPPDCDWGLLCWINILDVVGGGCYEEGYYGSCECAAEAYANTFYPDFQIQTCSNGNASWTGHGTGSDVVTINYPCTQYGFYDGGTGSCNITIYIPSGMEYFHLHNSTGTNVYNVYYNSATTVFTWDFSTGSPTLNTFDNYISSPGCGACTDSNACNYNPNATDDDGSCDYVTCTGCTDPNACNYDSTATNDDGSCEVISCAGCTDSSACNYDPNASIDDGSCSGFTGCTDSSACNYDSAADCDDGSCLNLDECGECGGSGTIGCTDNSACNYDADADCDDGLCTYPGCTNISACNYDSVAGCDDGSCEYLTCRGCTGQMACNYDSNASIDDGTCEYISCAGCTISLASNYDSTATIDDGSCVFEVCDITIDNQAVYDGAFSDGVASVPENICPADLNIDGVVNAADLLECLGSFGASCE